VTIKIINFHFGGLAPKFDPRPHDPRNLSSARRGGGADDPEKISEIAQAVAEKIEFEKKLGRPLAGNGRGHVTICKESYVKILYSGKI